MKQKNQLLTAAIRVFIFSLMGVLTLSLGMVTPVQAEDPTPADITITMTDSGDLVQGGTGHSYTVTVKNEGGTATSGTITVAVFTFPYTNVSNINHGEHTGWTCLDIPFDDDDDDGASDDIVCSRSDELGAGATYEPIVINFDVDVDAGTPITSEVDVKLTDGTNVVASDSHNLETAVAQKPDLTIAKSESGSFEQRGVGIYTITVKNSSAFAATDGSPVEVDITLPVGLVRNSLSGTNWTCDSHATDPTCSRDAGQLSLNAGASFEPITLTVDVAVDAGKDVPEGEPAHVVTEVVVSGGGQVNTSNDSDTSATTIGRKPDLTITSVIMVAGSVPPPPGPDDPPVTLVPIDNPVANETFYLHVDGVNLGGASATSAVSMYAFIDPVVPDEWIIEEGWTDEDYILYFNSNSFYDSPVLAFATFDRDIEITGGLPAGPHNIYVYVDGRDIVRAESDEGNNAYGPININITHQNLGVDMVDVNVGGVLKGSYEVLSAPSVTVSYPDLMDGPVKVLSTNSQPILTSQRTFYTNSFNEVMGYPVNQFTTEYWFPWYDQVGMQTWILVGNPSGTQTAYVDIYIGTDKTSYTIPPNGRVTPQFPGKMDGPVRVVSTSGAGTPVALPIFTSERSLYGSSFNEVMGYPANQFTTEYWFPWYDQIDLRTWILVGNPSGTQTAYVDIYIGADKASFTIPPNGRVTPQFPGKMDGPVRVVSTSGAGTPAALPIFTSERSLYGSSFNEVMGYPFTQFTTDYWFTWYQHNTGGMSTWLLVGNPSATQTAYVDITIGGGAASSFTIPPNGRITPQFNISNGPVHVASKTGAGTPTALPIFTSERSLYGPSFNEMMGYPADKLTNEYWFTWYDAFMTTELLISKP